MGKDPGPQGPFQVPAFCLPLRDFKATRGWREEKLWNENLLLYYQAIVTEVTNINCEVSNIMPSFYKKKKSPNF